IALEFQAAADARPVRARRCGGGVIAPVAGVARSLPALGEVVDQDRGGVVGALGIIPRRSFGVSEVEPEIGARAWLEVWKSDPQKRFAQQRVKFFEVVFERGFVVAGDHPKIAAIFLERFELQVARMQSQKHRRGADGLSNPGGTGIDGELLSAFPFVVPPTREIGRGEQQRKRNWNHEWCSENDAATRNWTTAWWARVRPSFLSGKATSTSPLKCPKALTRVPTPVLQRRKWAICSGSGS